MKLQILFFIFFKKVLIKKKALGQKHSNFSLFRIFFDKGQFFKSQQLKQAITTLPSLYL